MANHRTIGKITAVLGLALASAHGAYAELVYSIDLQVSGAETQTDFVAFEIPAYSSTTGAPSLGLGGGVTLSFSGNMSAFSSTSNSDDLTEDYWLLLGPTAVSNTTTMTVSGLSEGDEVTLEFLEGFDESKWNSRAFVVNYAGGKTIVDSNGSTAFTSVGTEAVGTGVDSVSADISINSGEGNIAAVRITVIPEPASLALMGLASLMLLGRSRRLASPRNRP